MTGAEIVTGVAYAVPVGLALGVVLYLLAGWARN